MSVESEFVLVSGEGAYACIVCIYGLESLEKRFIRKKNMKQKCYPFFMILIVCEFWPIAFKGPIAIYGIILIFLASIVQLFNQIGQIGWFNFNFHKISCSVLQHRTFFWTYNKLTIFECLFFYLQFHEMEIGNFVHIIR